MYKWPDSKENHHCKTNFSASVVRLLEVVDACDKDYLVIDSHPNWIGRLYWNVHLRHLRTKKQGKNMSAPCVMSQNSLFFKQPYQTGEL